MDVMSTTDIQDLIKRRMYTRGVIDAIAGSPDIDGLRTESETWTPRSRALVTSLLRCVPRPPLSVCLFVSIIASRPSLLCVLWMTQPPLLPACTLYAVRCTLYATAHSHTGCVTSSLTSTHTRNPANQARTSHRICVWISSWTKTNCVGSYYRTGIVTTRVMSERKSPTPTTTRVIISKYAPRL